MLLNQGTYCTRYRECCAEARHGCTAPGAVRHGARRHFSPVVSRTLPILTPDPLPTQENGIETTPVVHIICFLSGSSSKFLSTSMEAATIFFHGSRWKLPWKRYFHRSITCIYFQGSFHLPSISKEVSIYFHGSFHLFPWKLPSTSMEASIYFYLLSPWKLPSNSSMEHSIHYLLQWKLPTTEYFQLHWKHASSHGSSSSFHGNSNLRSRLMAIRELQH